jgi:hypothetical protein
MQMHRGQNSLHSLLGRSVREGKSMTKSDEIEECLAMSPAGLFVWVLRFWQRSPVDVREWSEFVDLAEISPEIRARVIALPSRASPAIGIARDICLVVDARTSAGAVLAEIQR